METRYVLLRCSVCHSEKKFNLNQGQIRQLTEGKLLQFHCSFCSCPQLWEGAEPVTVSDVASHTKRSKTKYILVVDDDDLTLKLLQKVLGAGDVKIETAQSGKDALSKMVSQSFDLVICDIHMPEMNGPELFRHIQENALLPPQRMIFLTGDKGSAIRQFLDSSGCYYLYKPIQFLDFSEQVQAVLADRPPA